MGYMNIKRSLVKKFNLRSALIVVSSFPQRNGQLAKDNAVAWYTHCLLSHFPSNKKVVVFAEKRSKNDKAWLLKENILIVPTFSRNPKSFYKEVFSTFSTFGQPSDVMFQFEFNSFGSNLITLQLPLVLMELKRWGKKTNFVFHQVIKDFNSMAGHVGLDGSPLKVSAINFMLKGFYKSINAFVDKVIVFDDELSQRLSSFIPIKKINVVPMGVEKRRNVSKKFARNYFNLKKTDFVFLVFGYKSWYKGTDWVVNELGKLSQKYPNKRIKLLLVGGSSPTVNNAKFEKKLARALKKYDSSVVETGYLDDEQLSWCFSASDVVLFPYRAMMSSSGALSHALGYAKPVLLSENLVASAKHADYGVSMLEASVGNNDLFFAMNTRDFQKTIMSVVNSSKQLRKLISFAKSLANKRSWANVAANYLDVISGEKKLIKSNIFTKLPELSVFFPLYNEQENIRPLVKHALKELPKLAKKFEIILVDDGSNDRTGVIADQLTKKWKQVKVVHQKNGGYGTALKTGFRSAKYDWVFFSDGDLQFDLSDLVKFIPYIVAYDAIIGVRENRADSIKRTILANMLKLWNRFFFKFPKEIKDIDCAFKLFNKEVVSSIFPLESHGAMISTEMLMKIVDAGFLIKQIGVRHYPRLAGEPTGANFNVILGAMKETLAIIKTKYITGQSSIVSKRKYKQSSGIQIATSSVS